MKTVAEVRTLIIRDELSQRPHRYRLEHLGRRRINAVRIGFSPMRVSLHACPEGHFMANYETATVGDFEIRKIIAELERRLRHPARARAVR